MEAKDTVMSGVETVDGTTFLPPDYISWHEHTKYMGRQAEISFPLGEKQGIDKGRREVVEWINKEKFAPMGILDDCYGLNIEKLETKLKEWGINKDDEGKEVK